MSFWNRPAVVEQESPTVEAAVKTVDDTWELLDKQGWCMWKCSTLHGRKIIVVYDASTPGLPSGYPVYSLGELVEQSSLPDSTVRLIYHIKKTVLGATIVSVEDVKKGGR